jgi:hypothetical protein
VRNPNIYSDFNIINSSSFYPPLNPSVARVHGPLRGVQKRLVEKQQQQRRREQRARVSANQAAQRQRRRAAQQATVQSSSSSDSKEQDDSSHAMRACSLAMAAEFMGHTSDSLQPAVTAAEGRAHQLLTQLSGEVAGIEQRHQLLVGVHGERSAEWGWGDNAASAFQFRHAAAGVANTVVCAVCGCKRSPADMMHDAAKVKQHQCTGVVAGDPMTWWEPVRWDSMPGKEILQAYYDPSKWCEMKPPWIRVVKS